MGMKPFDVKNNLVYILVLRWATLLHVALLGLLGLDIGHAAVFAAAIAYAVLLTAFWSPVTRFLVRYPLLVHFDLLIAAAMLWATGGAWKSPYFLYAFSALTVPPFFMGIWQSIIATGVFCFYYTAGVFWVDDVIVDIKSNQDVDTLLSNYVAFLLTVIFFGYPARVIKDIESTNAATSELKAYLNETNVVLAAVGGGSALTRREREIYALVCEGSSNAEIAAMLFISENTVKNHLYKVYKKLGVGSRSEAMLLCREEGMVPSAETHKV